MLKIEPIISDTPGYSFVEEIEKYLFSTNLDLLKLYKRASLYNKKGFKEKTKYYLDDKFENKVCYIEYVQNLEDGNLVGRHKNFKFLNTDETIGLEFSKYQPLEPTARQDILRSSRIRAIDGLINISKGTPLEGYISQLYSYYSQEIVSYKDGGTDDLINAILSEDDSIILGILSVLVSEGITVKDSILYSITD